MSCSICAGVLVLYLSRDVSLGEDSNERAIVVHDGKPPNLVACHQLERTREIVVRVDLDEFAARDFPYRHTARVPSPPRLLAARCRDP